MRNYAKHIVNLIINLCFKFPVKNTKIEFIFKFVDLWPSCAHKMQHIICKKNIIRSQNDYECTTAN